MLDLELLELDCEDEELLDDDPEAPEEEDGDSSAMLFSRALAGTPSFCLDIKRISFMACLRRGFSYSVFLSNSISTS